VLFEALQLPVSHLQLAQDCFTWVCRQQQLARKHWKARLQMIKNTAYAWRKCCFSCRWRRRATACRVCRSHFAKQRPAFRERFFPLERLASRDEGGRFDSRGLLHTEEGPARRFWAGPPSTTGCCLPRRLRVRGAIHLFDEALDGAEVGRLGRLARKARYISAASFACPAGDDIGRC